MKKSVFIFIIFALFSCRKEKVGFKPTPYSLIKPSHFPNMVIPEDNPLTKEGVELGRFLFYEKRLSGDNTMSCATCHMPQNGFSDANQFSVGIVGMGDRLRWRSKF
jgi:cytochrome c peroxidase